MSKPNISVQLYSVREQLAKDVPGTLSKLAAIGFRHVEPAGCCGLSAQDFGKALKAAGLKAPSIHGTLPLGDKKNQAIEEALALGTQYIITGGPASGWPGNWAAAETLKAEADLYNEAAANAAPHGLRVGFHNHDMEMTLFGGEPAYRIFLRHLAPEVLWTIDTYWVKVGGQDPVAVIKESGPRSKVIHIKDGPGVKGQPMVAAGEGVMDFPPIVAAAKSAELLCVELDACATDMMEAVAKSYAFLRKLV